MASVQLITMADQAITMPWNERHDGLGQVITMPWNQWAPSRGAST
jgi:hypothetical protein